MTPKNLVPAETQLLQSKTKMFYFWTFAVIRFNVLHVLEFSNCHWKRIMREIVRVRK